MGGCSSLYIFMGIEAGKIQFCVVSSRGDKTEYRGKTMSSYFYPIHIGVGKLMKPTLKLMFILSCCMPLLYTPL